MHTANIMLECKTYRITSITNPSAGLMWKKKMDNQKNGILNHLIKFGAIYLFIGQMIITFTTQSNKLQVIDTRLAKVEERQNQTDSVLIDVRTKLASIETSLEFIKRSVSVLDDYNIRVQK